MKPLRLILATASALSLLAAPATLAAQDTESEAMAEAAPADDMAEEEWAEDEGADDPMAALAGMMGATMIEVEPLTAEQQARVPAAEKVMARIWPEGAAAEMSQNMFGGMFGGFGDMMPTGAKAGLAALIGLSPFDLEGMTDEQATEALGLFDPVWEQRETAIKAMVPELTGEIMGLVEPPMRRAMTELYAIRFTAPELAAIDAFFATDTGAKYARESLSMASDKRMLAASMEAMPEMFAMIGQMEERMKARTESLPAPRSFADLSPEERAKVAALTGYSVEEIEANLEVDAVMAATEEATVD
ncbi:DUF2059 domain-containing protein [Erythrobacter donghaensis]|uniref:DUF2059 domain-containing protein n=1 Tax=Erythrobacter donghaensis TaxID=267135 RepID=UPI000A37A184|nr:DUF2059 domain-containing protein [Erythrobacter donghaensis]